MTRNDFHHKKNVSLTMLLLGRVCTVARMFIVHRHIKARDLPSASLRACVHHANIILKTDRCGRERYSAGYGQSPGVQQQQASSSYKSTCKGQTLWKSREVYCSDSSAALGIRLPSWLGCHVRAAAPHCLSHGGYCFSACA